MATFTFNAGRAVDVEAMGEDLGGLTHGQFDYGIKILPSWS
ncbi:MAG: hypothetical protein ACREVK_04865 [Gammaproteobacteria bacterium]